MDMEGRQPNAEWETYPIQVEGGRRMTTKQIYWKCVDCSSMINDENIHEDDGQYAEFCYGCMNYHPEVVLAYA